MNRIDLEFADGTYSFALPLPQIAELQRKCGNVGIGAIFSRVMQGRYEIEGEEIALPHKSSFFVEDLIETIRQGLIGGAGGLVNGQEVKVSPVTAQQLITTYVLPQPLADIWQIAAAVLGALIVGFDPPKKDTPPPQGAAAAATDALTST